jgi:type II secretory pathway pseudopilin PulG
MKRLLTARSSAGFTLLETVIAIGVLAVLLTGFLVVFTPAAAGIRKSIGIQEADRLISVLEQELVALRGDTERNEYANGFAKAFEWIKASNAGNAEDALMLYQYRGDLSSLRADGTPEPLAVIKNKIPGKDYVVRTMLRRKRDPEFLEDLAAVEGGVYFVKCTQLVLENGEMKPGTPGQITDSKGGGGAADSYADAVIAFTADFHMLPVKAAGYFTGSGGFAAQFERAKNPVFNRNLAVRR